MKKWMLVACVALLGLAQVSKEAQACDCLCDEEKGSVSFKPTHEQMNAPLGAFFPDLNEPGLRNFSPEERKGLRIKTFFVFGQLGLTSQEAIERYCAMPQSAVFDAQTDFVNYEEGFKEELNRILMANGFFNDPFSKEPLQTPGVQICVPSSKKQEPGNSLSFDSLLETDPSASGLERKL